MRLLKRKSRTFEIQVQEMTLHIQAATDVDEESRAAALLVLGDPAHVLDPQS